MNTHLFLQGPHGPFFRRLGRALARQGDAVIRVNCCGGDVVDWLWPHTRLFRKKAAVWGAWIARLMDNEQVTDLHVFGDWRPLHREAVLLARVRGIRVWAYEEGYLRPDYITMEQGGVNGLSSLPDTREGMAELAARCPDALEPRKLGNPQTVKTWRAIAHYAGTIFLWPLFRHFQTHRPQSASREVWGWLLRVLSRSARRKRSAQALRAAYRSRAPYFLFPLQLDADSQVRRYSPYSGMKEAIACVLTSFAQCAPVDAHIIIRNHPLDNGLIDYAGFIASFAAACGISDRVHFIEGGKAHQMMDKSLVVVVLNSTMGISALRQGRPVYCVGTSIYAMPGLAVNSAEMPLDAFWNSPRGPEDEALADFERVLKAHALVNGNFYTREGICTAIRGIGTRLDSDAGQAAGEAAQTEQGAIRKKGFARSLRSGSFRTIPAAAQRLHAEPGIAEIEKHASADFRRPDQESGHNGSRAQTAGALSIISRAVFRVCRGMARNSLTRSAACQHRHAQTCSRYEQNETQGLRHKFAMFRICSLKQKKDEAEAHGEDDCQRPLAQQYPARGAGPASGGQFVQHKQQTAAQQHGRGQKVPEGEGGIPGRFGGNGIYPAHDVDKGDAQGPGEPQQRAAADKYPQQHGSAEQAAEQNFPAEPGGARIGDGVITDQRIGQMGQRGQGGRNENDCRDPGNAHGGGCFTSAQGDQQHEPGCALSQDGKNDEAPILKHG